MPFRRKINLLVMLLDCSFFLRQTGFHTLNRSSREKSSLDLCLFRSIIVKCSLKCNIFCCVVCNFFPRSVMRWAFWIINHFMSFHLTLHTWLEECRGKGIAIHTTEAPTNYSGSISLFAQKTVAKHNLVRVCFLHRRARVINPLLLEILQGRELLTVVMCLSWWKTWNNFI